MFDLRDFLLVATAAWLTWSGWYFASENREDLTEIPQLEYATDPVLTYGHDPKPCFGYDNATEQILGMNGEFCPPHHAYYLNSDVGIRHKHIREGRVVQLIGTCCRLPADDILTDEHVYNALESCPYNYVATGGTGAFRGCGKSCTMRCTKINSERYQLGEERQAMYWKTNLKRTSSGRGEANQIKWHHLPKALRYAAGRTGPRGWSADGCVGVPFGSLLVKKKTYTCDGFYYRPLLFKDGSAVRTLPECSKVKNLISKSKPAVCIP